MITVGQIRAGIETVYVTKMKTGTADNLLTNIPNDHLHANYALAKQLTDDATYPKVVITLDQGNEQPEPAKKSIEKMRFNLVYIFRDMTQADPSTVPVGIQVEKCVDDVKKLTANNHNLGGLANNVKIREWSTDSGFSYPEGVAIFDIEVEYRNSY